MNVRANCESAETLAGAIALGEAGQHEREAYRAHLSQCERCLNELGGEREIERVMTTVAQARDSERWEPRVSLKTAHRRRSARAFGWTAGFAACAAMLVLFFAPMRTPRPVAAPQSVARVSHDQRDSAIAALETQTSPKTESAAESLAVGEPVTPAHATTFQVTLDPRGLPVNCTIVKSSGQASRDAAICGAAMRDRYAQACRTRPGEAQRAPENGPAWRGRSSTVSPRTCASTTTRD